MNDIEKFTEAYLKPALEETACNIEYDVLKQKCCEKGSIKTFKHLGKRFIESHYTETVDKVDMMGNDLGYSEKMPTYDREEIKVCPFCGEEG